MADAPEAVLHHPWEERDRQHEAMLFGLWVFLATEVLFFGGLFLLYTHARALEWPSFVQGARKADPWFGTANTIVLMTSSLTIAVAERATRAGWFRLGRWGWIVTAALGATFLIVKGFEYRSDLKEHLFPGMAGYPFPGGGGATEFWNFYWMATVVHAIHLTIGIGCVIRLVWLDRKGTLGERWMGAQVTTVYWHLVDIIWVVLYPLIYLVGR